MKKQILICTMLLLSIFMYAENFEYKMGQTLQELQEIFPNIQQKRDDQYLAIFDEGPISVISFLIDEELGLYYVKEVSTFYVGAENAQKAFDEKALLLKNKYGLPQPAGKNNSLVWKNWENEENIDFIWLFIQGYGSANNNYTVMTEIQFANKIMYP